MMKSKNDNTSEFINLSEIISEMGLSRSAQNIRMPRFLRREGNTNFRVLSDVLDPVSGQLTFSALTKQLNFNSPNHYVKMLVSQDSALLAADSETDKNKLPEEVEAARKKKGSRVELLNKMQAREELLKTYMLLYGQPAQHKLRTQVVEVREGTDSEADFVKMFRKVELARQNVNEGKTRYRNIIENKKKAELKNAMDKAKKEDDNDKKMELVVVLQKFTRGYHARKQTKAFRKKKMEFLGMKVFNDREPRAMNEAVVDLEKRTDFIEERRRQQILEKQRELEREKIMIREELEENEGPEILEEMMEERREFILSYYEMHEGRQLPANEKVFYDRFELKDPRTLEEDAKNKNKKSNAKSRDAGYYSCVRKIS